jgi:hypothetical protein
MSENKSAASTDATGFYYLDSTNLTRGAPCIVNVTIPKGFKTSLPASQAFVGSASLVKLADFVLN